MNSDVSHGAFYANSINLYLLVIDDWLQEATALRGWNLSLTLRGDPEKFQRLSLCLGIDNLTKVMHSLAAAQPLSFIILTTSCKCEDTGMQTVCNKIIHIPTNNLLLPSAYNRDWMHSYLT